MAEIVNFPDPRNDRAEAEAWLARLDGDEFSAADAAALRQWLREKPEHKRAILEALALWSDLDVLSDLREMFPLAAQRAPTRPIGLALLFNRPLIMAAAVLCLISGLLLWNRPDMPQELSANAAETVLRTTVGQQGRYDLADGSQVILNTDSLLETEFTAERRDLRLVKGEAHFQVAHDPQRPFLVHAGSGVVRAIGTAFNVHLKGEAVEVNVTEGKVLVAAAEENEQTGAAAIVNEAALRTIATELKAGQSVEYNGKAVAEVRTLQPELLARRLAWQSGMLMFQGETLAEVVAEISRYTNTEIIIADPAIRGIPIGGYFRTGEVEALLTVLEDSFAIRVNRIGPNLVYLNGSASVSP